MSCFSVWPPSQDFLPEETLTRFRTNGEINHDEKMMFDYWSFLNQKLEDKEIADHKESDEDEKEFKKDDDKDETLKTCVHCGSKWRNLEFHNRLHHGEKHTNVDVATEEFLDDAVEEGRSQEGRSQK